MPVPTGPRRVPPPRDSHQLVEDNLIRNEDSTIRAAKHFAQLGDALIKLMQDARAQGSSAQATRFVGMTDLCFVDDFDFTRVADQAALYGPLQYFQDKVVDRSLTLRGVKLWNAFADGVLEIIKRRQEALRREASLRTSPDTTATLLLILRRLDHLSLDVRQLQAGAAEAPEAKRPKLPHTSPSLPTYRPGHSFAFKLLKQTDELLEKHDEFTKDHLADYSKVLEQTAYFQLFSLDIAFQACKQLLDRREALRAVLDEHEVGKLCDLQVSKVEPPVRLLPAFLFAFALSNGVAQMAVDDASDIEVSEARPAAPSDEVNAAIAAIL
ncbi:hypothetical protein C0992_006821 [Termitomyces sp. T32_za158]|nr:hypothetical protein C0992_006821 [Termitomyces sp. T32_za158]